MEMDSTCKCKICGRQSLTMLCVDCIVNCAVPTLIRIAADVAGGLDLDEESSWYSDSGLMVCPSCGDELIESTVFSSQFACPKCSPAWFQVCGICGEPILSCVC